MRITRIRIGSFGGVKDRDYRLSGGADVLYGANESGKTSTMEMIRSVLSPSRKKRYPAKARTDSGSLEIEDEGETRTLELGSKDVSGIPEAVRRTDPDVFRRIFAMGPADLDDSSSVSEGEIRNRFLTIPGGEGVPSAIEWADREVQSVVGLRSSSRSELLAVERGISETEASIAQMKASADEYGRLASEEADLQKQLDELKEASSADEETKKIVDNYRNNKGNYEALKEKTVQRQALGDFVPASFDDIQEEARLRQEAEVAGERLRSAQDAVYGASRRLEGVDSRRVSRRRQDIDEIPGKYAAYLDAKDRSARAPDGTGRQPGRERSGVTVLGILIIVAGLAGCLVTPYALALAAAGLVVCAVGLIAGRRSHASMPSTDGSDELRRSMEGFERQLDELCADLGIREQSTASKVDALQSVRQAAEDADAAQRDLMTAKLADSEAKSALGAFYTRFAGEDGFKASCDKTSRAQALDGGIKAIRDSISRSGLDPDQPVCPVEWVDKDDRGAASELGKRIGELNMRMRAILDMADLERGMDRLESLKAEKAGILRRGAVALIARSLIDSACGDAFGSVQPAVVATADRYFRMMTGGAWSLEIDPRDGALKVVGEDGARDEGRWSTGLRAQALLSVKLAVAKEMGHGEIPMVLDDVLLPFDSGRKRGALRALRDVSEEMQVILFTCDAETRSIASEEGLTVQSMRTLGRRGGGVSERYRRPRPQGSSPAYLYKQVFNYGNQGIAPGSPVHTHYHHSLRQRGEHRRTSGNGATDPGKSMRGGLVPAESGRGPAGLGTAVLGVFSIHPWRVLMNIDPSATKYMVKAKINADGIVEKPDVVGAIFGQTEGLLGDELDLRDLQKSGRIGRIEVEITSKGGKSEGIIYMSSSLDQVETVILASALETVDRVGPCKASIHVLGIEDVRVTKREKVVERAKELLSELVKQSKGSSTDLTDSVRQSVQVEEITTYGKDHCPAGPNVKDSESIIIVEGRSDVLNLLKAGIKNAIAVEGTNIPKTVQDLSRERVSTAFVDGDRGGELILRELFQVADIDFVARAPRAHEVEELSAKQLVKCLRNKMPGDQYMEMNGLVTPQAEPPVEETAEERSEHEHRERRDRREDRGEREDRRERRERRDRREDRGEREDRRERKERFDSTAIDKYRKKEDSEETAEEPRETRLMIHEAPSQGLVEAPEERPAITAPAEEPEIPVEVPVAENPAEEPAERPKTRTRSLRGKKQSNKNLSPEQEEFRDMLLSLSTTHNAKILAADHSVIREVAVKSLVNTLKEEDDDVAAIVFDGVISQRILDVSADKGIKTVVGTRKGNITKMPADIVIWTKEDLY